MARCGYCDELTYFFEKGAPVCVHCLMDPMRKRNVRNNLVRDLDQAVERANAASKALDAVITDLPSALPHPEGTQRIQNASRELMTARQKVVIAHNRLNDYLNRGIVPADLKRVATQFDK